MRNSDVGQIRNGSDQDEKGETNNNAKHNARHRRQCFRATGLGSWWQRVYEDGKMAHGEGEGSVGEGLKRDMREIISLGIGCWWGSRISLTVAAADQLVNARGTRRLVWSCALLRRLWGEGCKPPSSSTNKPRSLKVVKALPAFLHSEVGILKYAKNNKKEGTGCGNISRPSGAPPGAPEK